jgi:hypothetical protein
MRPMERKTFAKDKTRGVLSHAVRLGCLFCSVVDESAGQNEEGFDPKIIFPDFGTKLGTLGAMRGRGRGYPHAAYCWLLCRPAGGVLINPGAKKPPKKFKLVTRVDNCPTGSPHVMGVVC